MRNFPCEKCKGHFFTMLKDHLDTHISDEYSDNFIFLFKLHNIVNDRLGKQILSLNQVYDIYSNIDTDNSLFWFLFHLWPKSLSTNQDYQNYINMFYTFINLIPTKSMRDLFLEANSSLPIENVSHSPISFFNWSYAFRNFIDTKLGIDIPEYNDIYKMYFEYDTCSTFCSPTHSEHSEH